MAIGSDFDDVLSAARAGQEWAFAVLFRDLDPPLLRYLRARAPAVAEDLSAETWLAAARGLAEFRGDEAGFRAWLFTIGRRQVIQHWRDRARRPTEPFPPDDLAALAGTADPAADALARVAADDAARLIARHLTPEQADVVLLRLLAGLDVDQVARMLGKRPGAVRALQHKALRRLTKISSLEVLTR